MPRRKDLACDTCGELGWRGPGTRPPGEYRCQPCRKTRPVDGRTTYACAHCGAEFRSYKAERRFCSRACHGLAQTAAGMGKPAQSSAKRERLRSAWKEQVSLEQLAERDAATCYLCGGHVDMALSGLAPMGPTIDHVVPLSRGGEHSYANTALAHRACNTRKGARVPA